MSWSMKRKNDGIDTEDTTPWEWRDGIIVIEKAMNEMTFTFNQVHFSQTIVLRRVHR